MRILFVASSLPTHFFAMAPFAWAARAAGHDVQVAAQPALCDAVAASGLPTAPAGRLMDFSGEYRARRPAGSADPKALYAEIASDMAGDLIALASWWRPDIVVWEPTSFAGPIVAAVAGTASVRYLWGPDIVGRGGSGRDRMTDLIGGLCDRYGVDLHAIDDWVTVDPCPPSLQLPTTAPWRHVRFVPHSTAGRVDPAVLGPAGRPRVVITLGLSGLVGSHALLAPMVASALADADVQTIITIPAGQRAELAAAGPLPANASIIADCPLPVLLAGAAAVVNHGGAGTLLSGAAAGLPQLVLSLMPDVAFNGDRLAATGAGLRLAAADADAAAIRDAVAALRDQPAFGLAAAGLRDEVLRQPTPAQLAGELTDPATFLRSPLRSTS